MPPRNRTDPDSLFLRMLFRRPAEITDEELAYFAEHPDQIDEFTAPINIHRLFLWAGALLGAGSSDRAPVISRH